MMLRRWQSLGTTAVVRRAVLLMWVSGLAGCGLNPNAPERPVVTLDVAPPPIVGGTLAVSTRTAFIADPDRDAVHVVDLYTGVRVARHALPAGSEPGRVVLDAHGDAHVVLRGGGAVLSVSAAGELTRTPVCEAPRGLDVDTEGVLWVACWSGDVWRVSAQESEPVVTLEPGLRDLVVLSGHILVSHLRSARIHVLSLTGERVDTLLPPAGEVAGLPYHPNTATRLRRRGNRAWLLHQRSRVGPEPVPTTRYAGTVRGPCGESSVQTVVSPVTPSAVGPATVLRRGSWAVDLDVDATGEIALALASEIGGWEGQRARRVRRVRPSGDCLEDTLAHPFDGQAVAVAFDPEGRLAAFSREPARLTVGPEGFDLAEPSRRDTGHDLFHVNRDGISCVSCHAEGADDGHLWTLGTSPARRTRSLRGGIQAPFHADGDVTTLHEVMRRQFPEDADAYLEDDQVGALASWLDGLAPRSRPGDGAGAGVFAELGCTSCHGDARLSADLGGGLRTVPPLHELRDRAPYLADGCATELEDVFDTCAEGPHAAVGRLPATEREALLAHLRTR